MPKTGSSSKRDFLAQYREELEEKNHWLVCPFSACHSLWHAIIKKKNTCRCVE